MPSWRSVENVGKPVSGSVGKSSVERVAEAHVHAALDLPLAQHRVHGLADVVHGDDPLDLARLAVDDRELGGVAEGGVDRRVRVGRVAELGRPVDDVLAVVVDVRAAAVGERRGARLLHRARRHQRAA